VVKEVLTAYLNLFKSSVKTVSRCVVITCDKFIGYGRRLPAEDMKALEYGII
jgi:hypothetical protein